MYREFARSLNGWMSNMPKENSTEYSTAMNKLFFCCVYYHKLRIKSAYELDIYFNTLVHWIWALLETLKSLSNLTISRKIKLE